ncbi:MAG TPA: sugar phosphate nucleotidyltransferase [Bacteroidia bacterium]|nr:sugar phosphate nucleotidyltransferase [Bacteroidia bacterium]
MIKAIIPVAGVGTTLRPHTHTQPKPLIPVAGKPILGHIIENLMSVGIKDFVFVIGYLGEKIEEFVRGRYEGRIQMEFVVQSPREGTGHAIWVARNSFIEADEILIVLGDTIFDVDLEAVLRSLDSTVGVQVVDDPRKFGVAMLDERGYVTSVVEKPRIPKSNLALVGLYRIKEVTALVDALQNLIANKQRGDRNEYHLTDAIMKMIAAGVRIRTHMVDNWFDCGQKESLLETNRILLERIQNLPEYQYPDCVILHPVHISENCTIEGSIIGPNVAIAENAVIRNSIVRNSILGAYSQLDSIVLNGSVIGNDASLRGKSNSVNIGDNTEIDFNS